MNEDAQTSLVWEGYEHIHQKKTTEWYTAVSIITIACALSALLFSNVLLSLLIVIASVSIMIHASQKPKHIEFMLNQRGVHVSDKLFPYGSLESFSIADDSAHTKLIIKSEKLLMPFIIIPIDPDDGDTIRQFLLRFISEEKLEEPFTEQIMEYLGL